MTSGLVTIGIPAYNRPALLQRAVSSALSQDHGTLEVLVSDDASPDPDVERVARRLASQDSRIRFFRQPRNLGHAGNYQWVLENAQGSYFMWLSDDDWIDPGYVSRCLAALQRDPRAILVCGLGRYYADGTYQLTERPIDLTQTRPGLRIVRYFARVSLNGPLFGLARRETLLGIGFPHVVGGDWLLIAALAARGNVRTLPDVHIHRSLTGLGADATELARSFGLRGLASRQHHLLVAARTWREITGSRLFDALTPAAARRVVATISAAAILIRFPGIALVRQLLGSKISSSLEVAISAWLRQREEARR